MSHPLEYLSEIQDLLDLSEFMDDKDFDEAMDLALKCIAKPDMPPAAAKRVVTLMESYAFKFKMMGQVFMTIKQGKAGTEENKKKNVYFAMSERCHDLSLALRYLAREGAYQ